MANCLLAFNNRIDNATVSGGSWLAGLPLSNVKDPIYGVPARSFDTNLTSTQFLVDIGVDKMARAVALVAHTISLDGKVRIRASESDPTMNTGLLYDSGWFDAWPSVYQSEALEWESPNFWEGQYTEEEREGLTFTLIKSADVNLYARYWLIEIDDTVNTDGYVQIGRVFIGEAWQPSINMLYGAGIGLEDDSEISQSVSGSEDFDQRAKYRVAAFTISNLDVDEAYGQAFDLMRRVGVTGEVLFQYDPDDTLHALRRSFVGRLRKLSAIEHPNLDAFGAGWEIKERL